MTRTIRLKRDLLLSFGAQAVRYLAPLLIYPFLAHKLGAAGFGIFAVFYTAAMIGASLIDFGYGISAVRVLASSREGSRTYLGVLADVVVGKSFNTAIIAAFAALWAVIVAPGDMLAIAASLCLAIAYGHNWNWVYMGTARLPTLAAIDTTVSFAQLALIIVLVKQESGVHLPIVLMALPPALAAISGYILAGRELGFHWAGWRRFRTSLRSSYRVFSMTGIYPLANRMQIIVAGAMVEPQLVGFFAMADRLAAAANGMLNTLLRVLMPYIIKLTSSDGAAGASKYNLISRILPVLTLSGCIVIAATSELWFHKVFEAYSNTDLLIFCLTLFAIPISAQNKAIGLLKYIPQKKEKLYQKFVLMVVLCALTIILPVAFIWGIFGIIAVRYFTEATLLFLSTRKQD